MESLSYIDIYCFFTDRKEVSIFLYGLSSSKNHSYPHEQGQEKAHRGTLTLWISEAPLEEADVLLGHLYLKT